jgi:hypothetical protein
MAKPIKDTPILTGQEAKNFLARMLHDSQNPISKEVKERMLRNFNTINGLMKETNVRIS